MLYIRPEQMQQAAQAAYKDFEDRMVVHLQELYPEQYDALGEEEVREEIKYGSRRAEVYGFEAETEVCRYIALMFSLGSDFDADPDFEDLHEVLQDETLEDPEERMDQLYDVALKTLEQMAEGGA